MDRVANIVDLYPKLEIFRIHYILLKISGSWEGGGGIL